MIVDKDEESAIFELVRERVQVLYFTRVLSTREHTMGPPGPTKAFDHVNNFCF